jgi:glycosyltransferase involved in cell wall biosynthesis
MFPILYVLHSGNLYGTEQMALTTLDGLDQQRQSLLLAPPGPVHEAAQRMGLKVACFSSPTELLQHMRPYFRQHPAVSLVTTGVSQSLIGHGWATLMGRRLRHLHIVHGGTDERLSYGRKSLLAPLAVDWVAVSSFVKDRLVAHGCPAQRIHVIENFLRPLSLPQRGPFERDGVRKVAIISRTDPIKRVGMLLVALERFSVLRSMQFSVFGHGSDYDELRQRFAAHPNVTLHGLVPQAAWQLHRFDLLLHTCAEEPFGLALLEAMAARVPILAPNAGGAASLVTPEVSGFHFPANDAVSMGQALVRLHALPAAQLQAISTAAHAQLQTRFAPERGWRQYREVLEGHAVTP